MASRLTIGMFVYCCGLFLIVSIDAMIPRNVTKPLQIKVEIVARETLPGVPERYSDLLEWAALDTGTEWQAHAALYKMESNFDESSIHLNRNGTYDIGAGQANSRYIPEFWARYLPEVEPDPLNLKQNVIVCSRHFARMIALAGSLEGGAIAYHRGLQAYRDGVKDEAYVERFLRIYNEYKSATRGAQGVGPCTALIKAPSYASGGALILGKQAVFFEPSLDVLIDKKGDRSLVLNCLLLKDFLKTGLGLEGDLFLFHGLKVNPIAEKSKILSSFPLTYRITEDNIG